MPKFFVNNEQVKENEITILGEDVNHIKNVLRLKIGDKINVCNIENSDNYTAEIVREEISNIICNIIEKKKSTSESSIYLHIIQGLPKAEKMELIIEKSVELGVKEITPVLMKRSVVKLDDKSKFKKVQRWQKISETAAKQSGRDIIPKINNVIVLEKIYKLLENYDIVLVAYEKEKNNSLKQEIKKIKETLNKDLKQEIKIAIVIGPEGGIEEKEVEFLKSNGAHIITLGNRILRTETVALSVSSVIMYEFDN